MRKTWLFAFAMLAALGQVRADSNAMMRFAGNIHQFNQLFPQEKVYLQFDNTAYFEGDDIWFKAFVVKSSTLGRTESGVLYVDLLSADGVLLQQQKIKIVAGQADGRIQLVDYATEQARKLRGVRPYPSGYYEVRAYTQYMLNFDPGIIFSRVLPVYQTPEQEGNYSNPVIAWDSIAFKKSRQHQEKVRNVNVQFFPEGGNMVRDLPCRVAFKATDGNGAGIKGTLTVQLDDGSKVVTESGHEGMGSFDFTPGRKQVYATFEHGGKNYRVKLPEVQGSGYTMMVHMDDRNESLNLAVNRSLSRREGTIGMTVTCRGELIMFQELAMDGSDGKFSFDIDKWPAGVCRIVLFTDQGEVLAARSVYNGNLKYVAPVIDVKADKQRYDAFGKMHLSFQLKGKDGKPIRDRFCISVRDAGDYGTQYADNLLTDFLLTSDLKGFIHNPSYYFESSDNEHLRNLDLLCMVQGWERYEWDYMTDNKAFQETHRMETGLSLNGMITTNHIILKDFAKDKIKVYVALSPRTGEYVEYGQYITDKNGYFGFDTREFYGKVDVTMRLTKAKDSYEPRAKILMQRAQLPEARVLSKQELLPWWSDRIPTAQTTAAEPGTTLFDFPAVINEAEGITLPVVRIDGDRKYVDYFTFKSYDVEKDVDLELDLGKYSTDVAGYLIDKGFSVWYPVELGSDFTEPAPVSFNNDENHSSGYTSSSIVPPEYNYFELNDHNVMCYVHDDNICYTSGKYSRPWSIDTQDVESILIFDDLHSISEIADYAPEYLGYLSRYRAVPSRLQSNSSVLSKKWVLMDIKLKHNHTITDTPDRFNLGKRATTMQGFSQSYEFFAPEYPNGAILGDVDYRRTLYWNPNVIADENGRAEIEFYNNSYSTRFNVSGAGITASGMPYVLDKDF